MKLNTITMDPPAIMSVTLRARLTCLCPVNDRRDYATVEVTYTPEGWLIELESFAAFLGSFSDRTVTHERVTVDIAAAVREATRCDEALVKTEWLPVEGVECIVTAKQ